MAIRLRWRWALSFVLVLGLLAAVPAVRRGTLRQLGRALVASDPVERADLAVLMTAVGAVGELEVADLVHEGRAGRVLVMVPPPSRIEGEYARRGVSLETPGTRSVRILGALGVPIGAIDVLEVAQGGTVGELAALRQWCAEHRVGSVIVVSDRPHSRRARRTLRRAMADTPVGFFVNPPRFDRFDVADWWSDRDSLRAGIIELEKLALDWILHPLS